MTSNLLIYLLVQLKFQWRWFWQTFVSSWLFRYHQWSIIQIPVIESWECSSNKLNVINKILRVCFLDCGRGSIDLGMPVLNMVLQWSFWQEIRSSSEQIVKWIYVGVVCVESEWMSECVREWVSAHHDGKPKSFFRISDVDTQWSAV